MDLRLFDLNPLVAFDALLTERNVTHAGSRQPQPIGDERRAPAGTATEANVSVAFVNSRSLIGPETP